MYRHGQFVLLVAAMFAGCQHAQYRGTGAQRLAAQISPVPPSLHARSINDIAVAGTADRVAMLPPGSPERGVGQGMSDRTGVGTQAPIPGAVVSVFVPMDGTVLVQHAIPAEAARRLLHNDCMPQQPVPTVSLPTEIRGVAAAAQCGEEECPVRAMLEFDPNSEPESVANKPELVPMPLVPRNAADEEAEARERELEKLYCHAPDYGWLVGKLYYVHARKSWHVRYASINSEDVYGGSVELDVSDRSVQDLRNGQLVLVQGGIIETEPKKTGNSYRVRLIQPLFIPPQ